MKKSVVILISVLYVVSIVVVGFFGMKVTAVDTAIYINRIECTNEGVYTIKDDSEGLVQGIDFVYKIGGDPHENTLIITYEAFPNDSTAKGTNAVRMTAAKGQSVADIDGLKITFKGECCLTVYLNSQDGSKVTTTIEINAFSEY